MLRTAMLYSILFIFMTQPTIPKIIDISLRNGTAPGKLPYPAVYSFIDEQKYYFYLIVFLFVCGSVMSTTLVSNDIILIVFVQHVCGVLAALG